MQIREQSNSTTRPLVIFTDHHFLNDITCFSWVLFNHDGETLANGWGPCPGPPTRTRADAWSLLASTLFLRHLSSMTRNTNLIILPHITIINQNRRLIRQIQEHTRTYHIHITILQCYAGLRLGYSTPARYNRPTTATIPTTLATDAYLSHRTDTLFYPTQTDAPTKIVRHQKHCQSLLIRTRYTKHAIPVPTE
jgi:hypothetical protein